MLVSLLSQLLLLGLFLLLIAGMLSPFESLGWWAGWFGVPADQHRADADQEAACPEADYYVVYLSGIGAIAGDTLEPAEVAFLDKLAASIPGVAIVRDVFPYAMNNNGLTGQRFFVSMWRAIKWLKLRNRRLLTALVNIRNMFQVAVSADRRYGPIYNYGTAEVIVGGLLHQGYRLRSGKLVTLICFSGGAQIALGAATYLQALLEGDPHLQIISLGGVMADDPGLEKIAHLYHFHGSKDPIHKLGAIVYAGRWPVLPYSPWNQAKAREKISMIAAGPLTHNDPGGYFLPSSAQENQGYQERIVQRVIELIQRG